MKLGVILSLNDALETELDQAVELGLPTFQLNCWEAARLTPETASWVAGLVKPRGLEITALWCGWEGPAVWNQTDGPLTLGLVPPAFRHARLQMLLRGADFASWLGVRDMVTHVGFIPENPNDPEYPALISALRYLVQHCRARGVHFLFESGQETPVTLLRAIEDIGLDNVGVNLDPANLILYGKANPVDALDVIGRFVRGVHAKDGLYPTTGRELGTEVPLGQGKVNFPRLVAGLKEYGYEGALTIEREISGPEQRRDILAAKEILSKLIA